MELEWTNFKMKMEMTNKTSKHLMTESLIIPQLLTLLVKETIVDNHNKMQFKDRVSLQDIHQKQIRDK